MTTAPIAFQSNPGRYSFEGTTQLVNAYAEKLGKDGKAQLAVMPSEGLVEFADTGSDTPCRGLIFCEDLEKIYSVHSDSCYKITSGGTATRIGTVPGVDVVQLSRNQKTDVQIVIKNDSGVQIIESDAISYVTDTDLPDVVTADVVSGYAAYGIDDTRFFLSNLNSAKLVDALDFATFETRSGKLLRIIENSGNLVGLCSTWMEFWRNTGNVDFPFQPMGFRSRGLKAANAVIKTNGTFVFPGDDARVYTVDNYDPVPISNNEITRLIQDDAAAEDIIGFGWDRGQHAFSCLTGTDWTRCYDATTQVWHSRQSYGYDTWRGRFSVRAFGKTIVGDKLTGKLFYLDGDTYTEDDDPLVWKVISPPLHVFPNGAILDAVHFDLATGYGTLSGQGSDPKVMLRTSTDGGNTFTNYRELELGTTGDYKARVTARRLGRFGPKGIVFELSISDPVARSLVNCDVQLRPLKR